MADPNQPEDTPQQAGAQQPGPQAGNRADAPHQAQPNPVQDSQQTEDDDDAPRRSSASGRALLFTVVALAAIVTLIAVARAIANPRTDDAEVLANYIGMAPQVEGPIFQLPIYDNEFVRAGDLLFQVDDRPYRYALERAMSDQAALEGQIEDRQRMINSQLSNVHVARATVASSASNQEAMNAGIAEARANLEDARAASRRAEADRKYAEDNLHRLEPLLKQQFVTVDQVDQARTLLETRSRAVQQAEAQVALNEAHVLTSRSHYEQAGAEVEQRRAQTDQAANAVETLAPLTNQREERAAAVRTAQYNLNNTRVYAPFDGYITNLTISVGQYVHTGAQVFTMIDSRAWWVVANFRETQLKHVAPGSAADVFLMSHDNLPLRGIVESIGYGVTPDPTVTGLATSGLPAVQRSLSWVHLAARYPVRIRVVNPPPNLLRIGQTAVAVIHPGNGSAASLR